MWDQDAWADYLAWQKEDPDIAEKINVLIKECFRTPFQGTGKPEALKRNLQGYWSRRITGEHRLVYRVDDVAVSVIQCKGHY
ncbi:Txe/YoeB family addiction module toxin [Hymenobacter agri]